MKTSRLVYVVIDWLGAIVAWALFFFYRKQIENPEIRLEEIFNDRNLIIGLLIIPAVWICWWAFLGSYSSTLRKSRLRVAYSTLTGVLIGCVGILLTVMVDDLIYSNITYVQSFTFLFLIHVIVFLVLRISFFTILKFLLINGSYKHRALLISDDTNIDAPMKSFTDIVLRKQPGEIFNISNQSNFDSILIHNLRSIKDRNVIPSIVGHFGYVPIYIHDSLMKELDFNLEYIPSLSDSYVLIKSHPLQKWEQNLKRIFDIATSILLLIICFPLFLWIAFRIKGDSPGPVLYSQNRVGHYGEVFKIFKFRSMIIHAESDGPQLAVIGDDRCTKFGSWMRRWRLDELPQFWNILIGDMSFVGPRPERPYFVKQLNLENFKYNLLFQVRPGLTSWGQIKYGYASSTEEMMQRFRYDLLYIENMSLILDLRVLTFTFLVLIKGKGR